MNSDVWSLIGRHLRLSDLPNFFSLSKTHAVIAERNDFWGGVCQTNFGDWRKDEFLNLTWKQIVKYLVKKRKEMLNKSRMTSFDQRMKDHILVRSPNHATVFYGYEYNKLMRDGDIIEAYQFRIHFCNEEKIEDRPPRQFCWPHKPASYCQTGKYVYIHLVGNQLYESAEPHVGSLYKLTDHRRPDQKVIMSEIYLYTLKVTDSYERIVRLTLVSEEPDAIKLAKPKGLW